MTRQLRQPKGAPGSVGGQFAPSKHAEGSDLDFESPFSLDGADEHPDNIWDVFPDSNLEDTGDVGLRGEVRWSFLPGWQQAEKTFDERLAEMPTRFFTTDLGEKLNLGMIPGWDSGIEPENEREATVQQGAARRCLGYGQTQAALCQVASTPDDGREQSIEDTKRLAESMGFTNLRVFNVGSEDNLYGDYAGRTYLFRGEPRKQDFGVYRYKGMRGFCLTDSDVHRVIAQSYSKAELLEKIGAAGGVVVRDSEWKRPGYKEHGGSLVVRMPDGGDRRVAWTDYGDGSMLGVDVRKEAPEDFPQRFINTSTRSLAGAYRIRQATGHNLFDLPEDVSFDFDTYRQVVLDTQKMQEFGRNVIAQRKYADNTGKKLARAWEDKKYPSKSHVRAAEESVLHGAGFGKIEIDNEVDLGEFEDFERAVLEARRVLPPIPFKCQPDLRVRKLGRHRVTGMYVPRVNTICVDVHDSGSFVHEYGHMLDFQGLESSLGSVFGSVVGGYRRRLRGVPEGKAEYYGTPTEVWARAFELYAVERLGVSGRLVHGGEYYREFDYVPFHEDPVLKETAFRVFDSLYGG